MAIPFNLPDIGRRIYPEETGVPDYISALSKGFKLGYEPRNLENEAYAKELSNKINEAKARYAMQTELANLQHTQASTGHIGAQTRGLNIENQYLPEKLRLANKIQAAKAEYAREQALADLNYTRENTSNVHEQVNERRITNKTLGEKLALALEMERFKRDNPLLSMPGMAGQIGSLAYLQQHPEIFGSSGNQERRRAPLDMSLNYGEHYGSNPAYQEPLESNIPSIRNRFTEEQPEIPYEMLSESLSNAFNNPNESRLASIARNFEEPKISELAKIPALMSLTGGSRPANEPLQEPSRQMNLADMLRESIISSINPKSKQNLSTLGKLEQEYTDIKKGFYPGSTSPINNEAERGKLLKQYEAQIERQISGQAGKDAETIQLNKDLLRERIEALRQGKPPTGKFAELEKLRDQYPKGSPDWNRYEKARIDALESTGGITIFDPKGNPMVQIGGKTGSRGTGKGGQLFQNANGDVYQMPTTGVQSQLQNRILGEKIVTPYLENIIEVMPQFQSGWTKRATAWQGFANTWLGADFELPSELQKGLTSMRIAAEGLLREFGLNATTQNLKRTEAIVTPGDGESPKGYAKRAKEQLLEFLNTAKQSQEMSNSGILVKSGSGRATQASSEVDYNNPAEYPKMSDAQLNLILKGGK